MYVCPVVLCVVYFSVLESVWLCASASVYVIHSSVIFCVFVHCGICVFLCICFCSICVSLIRGYVCVCVFILFVCVCYFLLIHVFHCCMSSVWDCLCVGKT